MCSSRIYAYPPSRQQCHIGSRLSTISDRIVETLYSNRVTSEIQRIHTPPPSPLLKLGYTCCFLSRAAAQHCMQGMREEKLYFPLLKSWSVKRNKTLEKPFLSQQILSPIVAVALFHYYGIYSLLKHVLTERRSLGVYFECNWSYYRCD